ncbi:RusA family crossover junction endodeoxyribonuclease [Comamonas sp.]|uniref:RusA family crossover junction endodeoxyribonuclease n=1 Tax=Comamonas sp. TaxID=34028 RepID=UPI0012C3852C|nr:RusA family crossover junction endodeoxyribonuclease [Comamonas sp.]MPS93791.1 RusA family crossover junction endodeoxyribonuclease [Comamonas sp.]
MITLTLPYPISANRYWQTRVIKVGAQSRAMTYVSSEAKAFKEQVGWLAKAAGILNPILGRVAISYTLHPHCPQDAQRRMKRDPYTWDDTVQCIDLDNAQKVLLDALKGVAIEDDKWVRRITAERGMPVDGGKLVVTITPIKAAPEQEQGDLLGGLA